MRSDRSLNPFGQGTKVAAAFAPDQGYIAGGLFGQHLSPAARTVINPPPSGKRLKI